MKKVAVIFGATGGIGKAILEQYQHEGYTVCAASRTQRSISTEDMYGTSVDVEIDAQVISFVRKCTDLFGRIDVCVFCVGYPITKRIQDTGYAEWNRAFSLYLWSLVSVVQAVVPIMMKQGEGSIVNIGGLRAFDPAQGKAIYCSLKSAASMFIEVLQKEVQQFGIKAFSIHPGFTDTNFHKEESKRPYEKDGKDWKKVSITNPSDIASLVYTLTRMSKGASVQNVTIGTAFDFDAKELRLVPCLQEKK